MQEILLQFMPQILNPERLPTALAALLLSVVMGLLIGPVPGGANPVSWKLLDLLFGKLGERMDRAHRSFADLAFRGMLLSALVLFVCLVLGELCRTLVRLEPLWGAAQVVLLTCFISTGSVWHMLVKLERVVEHHKTGQGAYYALAKSARINLAATDEHGLARAALGFVPLAFTKMLVAPVFWFILAGCPGLALYSGASFLAWRFGKRGFTKGFASFALALERLLGVIPAYLSALILTFAAVLTPTARTHKAIMAWFGLKGRAPYAQGGLPLSILAWALNVSLGGAAQDLSGSAIKGEWVGSVGATAQINHKHIRRAVYLSVVAHLLLVAALLGAIKLFDLLGVQFSL